jgi:predicted MPP superfamily phosphohydrolase
VRSTAARPVARARDASISAAGWLRRAAAMLAVEHELTRSAERVGGFRAGGRWMANALSAMRRRAVVPKDARFLALGVRKYALCLLAGSGTLALSRPSGAAAAVALSLLAFYAVEARHVFDFPAAIDYGRRAPVASRALRRRAGGSITILTRVLPIAAFMLFGGLVNGRPRFSFAVGCMAVLLWYESLRRREDTTPCCLELGASAPLAIRRVSDDDPGDDPIKVLYASDLHLGAFGASRAMRELQRLTVRERPDVVLLGGDLVDSRRALPELGDRIRRLRRFARVAAVPGNHDARWITEVAAEVTDAGGHWLPDRPLRLRGLRIDGALMRVAPGEGRRLLCAHHPGIFESAAALGYDIVMAGHLHGGQWILCDVSGRHFPGALHSRWTGPGFALARSIMWVSRGLADTFPARIRCPREVLLATLRRTAIEAV